MVKRKDEDVVETDVVETEEEYVYPYGEHQVHEALVDIDKRLKKLEPK